MHWRQGLVVVALAAAVAIGQQPAAPKPGSAPAVPPLPAGGSGHTNQGPGATGRSSAEVHTEARSREMFTACDGDSDDRLDLFEACDALETLGDPKDATAFRRIDRDRDGYVTWPEFDQLFRNVVQRGSEFRVRTCRRLVAQAPEQQQALPATPLQRFLKIHDQNGNGGLDPEEIDQLVRQAGLQPALGTQLKALDQDKSGRIEEKELAPFFENLRGSLPLPDREPPKGSTTLPQHWAAIDDSSDGEIDLEELTRALRRLDPSLVQWARRLLQQLDRDGNGKLGADELPGGAKAVAPAKT